jgi:putative oxygen-independent coproporphyrinogen III oxidase
MVKAICKEIKLKGGKLRKPRISTIYFGGGTPSMLAPTDLSVLVKEIGSHFDLSELKEFTFEMNPEHASETYLKTLLDLGINRISLGIQTFSNSALIKLNRGHDKKNALEAVENIKKLGEINFNLDLIFGLPFLNDISFQRDLDILREIDPPHISAYSLTIEPKTKFGIEQKKGMFNARSDEEYWNNFLLIDSVLKQNGYLHYEISNFCKPGFESIHNQNYWNDNPYIGIGPSSHSFDGISRSWNISNNTQYLKALDEKKIPEDSEKRDLIMKANERIITSLRTSQGLDLISFKKEFQTNLLKSAGKFFENPINQDLWKLQDNRLRLTLKGWFQSDEIISNLFLDRLT